MADGNIGFAADDLFSIASNFKAQGGTTRTINTYAVGLDANGDKSCESSALNVRTEYDNNFVYCGSAIKTDLGTVATNAGVANVKNSIAIDSISITWSNLSQPTLTVSGHNHAVNAHTTSSFPAYDWSGMLPATGGGGAGIPTYGTNYTITMGNDSKVTEVTVTFTVEHVDVEDESGDHLAGMIRNGRLDLSASGVGLYTDVTLGSNWIVDDNDQSESNTESDTWAVTAHAFIART